MIKKCIILGGGGHACVLIDILLTTSDVSIFGILDKNMPKDTSILGIPVIGDDSLLSILSQNGVTHFIVGIGLTIRSDIRKNLYERACNVGLIPMSIIHPSAVLSKWAILKEGIQIFPGSIINPRAIIGSNVIINSGSLIEHDCNIGDNSHIAPHATILGGVTIGCDVHIGAGAIIREGLTIGNGVIIGAGSVVITNIMDHSLAYGIPARVKNQLL
jgi:UDP-perosamine 4-acetyltransferase